MRALLAIAVVGLAALPAGAEEAPLRVLDLRPLLAEPPARAAPLLGAAHLGSWACEGGEGSEESGDPALRLSQIRALLGVPGREGPGDGAPHVEGMLFPEGDATRLAEDLQSLAGDLRRTVRIEVSVLHPGGETSGGEIAVRPGRWGVLSRTRARRLVRDMDVEIACDNSGGTSPSALGDPIVVTAQDGLAVEARPFLLPGGRRVALEAFVQCGRIGSVTSFLTGARWLGAIDLPTYRGLVTAVSGTVALGEPLVARLGGPGGETVVRLVPRLAGAPGRGRIRVHDAGLLLLPPARAAVSRGVEPTAWGRVALAVHPRREEAGLLSRSDLLDAIPRPPGSRVEGGAHGLVAVAGPPAARREVAAALARLARGPSRTVRVSIAARAGGQVVAETTLRALDGRAALARMGTDRTVVGDDDVEVGCYIQITDPLVFPVFSGWLVRVRPRIAPGGESVLLRLDAILQDLEGEPAVRSLGDPVNGSLHLLRLRRKRIRSDLVLGRGEAARIAAGRGPDGRPLVLEVRAGVEGE